MIKNLTSIFVCALFCLMFSCKNDSVSPKPDQTKPEETTIDKTLLTGWWAPVEKGKAKIYFGADNFFYQDTITLKANTNPDAPIAGFWSLGGSEIKYSAVANGTVTQTYKVTQLTANSLTVKVGSTISTFNKTSLPAITSPAITTIAGDGNAGYTGDGGPAVNATINGARGLVTDKAGNLYFCDQGNNVIRKIAATDGKITTIAGTGKQNVNVSLFNEGSLATTVDLVNPSALVFDETGNLYVSEAHFASGKVDKITPDGKIYLVAGGLNPAQDRISVGDGGPAVNANLKEPVGLAVDASNNIYIADIQNNRIRKVSATTGKISTVAGNGGTSFGREVKDDNGLAVSAELSGIFLALDANNNIYVPDMNHYRIRKITAATGIITTILGGNFLDGNGDGGNALNAGLNYPWGICINKSGDIIFTDSFVAVRKIDHLTNIVTKVAGNGYSNYMGDGPHATAYAVANVYAVATDAAGNVYIADGNRIRKVAAK